MRRNWLAGWSGLLTLLLFAAGCGSSSQAGGNTVEITIFGYDDGVGKWVEATTAAWKKGNHGYDIHFTIVPPNDLQQQLTTRARGGNPPDISSMPTAWVPSLADAKVLRDLGPMLGDTELKRIEPNLLKNSRFGGTQWVLPYGSSTRALYYNKEAFQKAGVSNPPKTWDEIFLIGPKLKQANNGMSVLSIQGKGNETFAAWFPYVYWSNGGTFGDDVKLAIDQPACTKSLDTLDRLVKGGLTQKDPTGSDITDIQDTFTAKKTAMTISGPWLLASAEKIGAGVAPLPAGSTQSTLGVIDGWSSFAKGKASEDQVKTVLTFLMSKEIELPLLQGRGFLPVQADLFSDPSFTKPNLKPFLDSLKSAKFAPLNAAWAQLQVTGTTELQAMYTGDKKPADVCQALEHSLHK